MIGDVRSTTHYLGVDIGGTKIAVGVVAPDGRMIERSRRATPRTGGADVIAAAAEVIAGLIGRHGPTRGIGVGAPGVIRDGSVVSATAVLTGWAGTAVAADLESAFGVPVAVDNDVSAAALGEARYGSGRGVDRLLVVSLGTGVGGAFVMGGVLQHGNHGTAGEIAHVLAPPEGPVACGCGRFDHLESHCCGPAIETLYRAATSSAGQPLALPELVRRGRQGDVLARTVVEHAGAIAGRAIAGIAGAVDIDAVVVTGGVAGIGDMLLVPLHEAFVESVIGPLRDIAVVTGQLGADAPLVGAASLAMPS